jgi:hypothetical protein
MNPEADAETETGTAQDESMTDSEEGGEINESQASVENDDFDTEPE